MPFGSTISHSLALGANEQMMKRHPCRLALRSVLQLLLVSTPFKLAWGLTILSGNSTNSTSDNRTSSSSSAADSVFGVWEGDHRCPCITDPAHLQVIPPKDFTDSVREGVGVESLYELNNVLRYGVGCGRHDLGTPQCSNRNSSCDGLDIIPASAGCSLSWCNRSFCYVDPVNCTLLNRRSQFFPHSGRFYSYATCGYADSFTASSRISSLAGRTFKAAFNSNTGGWLGAYSSDGVDFQGPMEKWHGPYVDFLHEAATQGGFQLELTEPPTELIPVARDYFKSKSKFDYCVYAASLGFVDLCIAQYTVSNQRASVTDWLLLESTGIFLILSEPKGSSHEGWLFFQESVAITFRPFTAGSWLFIIFFAIPVLGCLMIVHETGKAGSTYPNEEVVIVKDKASGTSKIVKRKVPLQSKIVKSVYINMLAVLQQSYEQSVTTFGAKLNLLGISFFILTICAAYTANLAALLTGQIQSNSIQSLDDAVRAGYRFCSERKNMESITALYPRIDTSLFVVDPEDIGGDGLPGFNCPNCSARSRVFTQLDPVKAAAGDLSYCHAALAPEEDLDVRHEHAIDCNLHTVGQPIQYSQTGIPIFEGVSQELISFFLLLKNKGYYDKQFLASKPTSQCPARNLSGGESLSLSQLSGIWVVSFSFAVAGLIATAIQSYHSKHHAKVVVQRVTKFDQRGGKIDALENEEEKIESIKARSKMGKKRGGSFRFSIFRSFRLGKKHDSLGGADTVARLNEAAEPRFDRMSLKTYQKHEPGIRLKIENVVLDDDDDDKSNQKLPFGPHKFMQYSQPANNNDNVVSAPRIFTEDFKTLEEDDDEEDNHADDDLLFDTSADQDLGEFSSDHSRSTPTIRPSNVERHPHDPLSGSDIEQP